MQFVWAELLKNKLSVRDKNKVIYILSYIN